MPIDEPDGPSRAPVWIDQETFDLRGVRFTCRELTGMFESTAKHFCLRKDRWAVELYGALLKREQPRRIVELGIFDGGSAAMVAGLIETDRIVALEISEERCQALDELAKSQPWAGSIRPHYGVDQSDHAHLSRIVEEEFGEGRLIDLIIDDASHHLDPTRSSFETLFPRLREGGLFLIEDWSWAHVPLPVLPHQPALSTLGFELMIACATSPGLIETVEINKGWIVLRRGPQDTDPDGFSLADLLGERGARMIPTSGGAMPRRSRKGVAARTAARARGALRRLLPG